MSAIALDAELDQPETIEIVTKDNARFTITKEAAKGSQVFAAAMDDYSATEIFCPEGTDAAVDVIIEYLSYKNNQIEPPIEVRPILPANIANVITDSRDRDLMERLFSRDIDDVLDVTSVCNYLGLVSLLHIIAAYNATKIRGKTIEEVARYMLPKRRTLSDDVMRRIEDVVKRARDSS